MLLKKGLFNVREYHQMVEAGILTERDRVELIAGEIIPMFPIGYRHASIVARLDDRLADRIAKQALRWIQNPILLNDQSQPQPDGVQVLKLTFQKCGSLIFMKTVWKCIELRGAIGFLRFKFYHRIG